MRLTDVISKANSGLNAKITMIGCAQVVKQEFDELYPGEVEAVHLVRNTRELDPKAAEYKKTVQDLIDLLDDYTSKRRRHKEIKRKKAGPWTSDVDGWHNASHWTL